MEDKFVKYSKLYLYIFLAAFAVVLGIATLIGLFYGFSKLVSSKPVDIAFEIIVLSIPTIIFSTAYLIFFKRTKMHPTKWVQYISYTLFIAALIYCGIGLFWAIKDYFLLKRSAISQYHTFTLPYLAGNIALLFIVGILQALTTEKEVDWRERKKGN
jgi:uncharacterized membrane protein